ncbi:MAG: sensor histidine kinase [Pseudomonadota bacterium]|jgi:LytS/YehU family sensor histidine kinase
MKIDRTLLRGSWQSWVSADMERIGPHWLQLVWTALFCLVLAAVFTVFGFVAYADEGRDWLELPRWRHWFGKNLIVTFTVGYAIHGLFELGGHWVGGPSRIRRFKMPARVAFFAGIPLLGTLVGAPLGLWLAGAERMSWIPGNDGTRAVFVSLAFWAVAGFIIYQLFATKSRAIAAERAAAEAQLRLLQAQMEPHFLFNTLANVQALIEHDGPKARRMLGAFTDYLRAGLANLRRERAPLAEELALAEAYLRVQQARMEERLAFTIDADEAARRALLPPLLLQPLVENAVVHGLEPQIAGGRVRVRARVEAGRLLVEVQDDGRGLAAAGATAPPRGGHGLALANLRERLRTGFGDAATLELMGTSPGTMARLRLPLEAA